MEPKLLEKVQSSMCTDPDSGAKVTTRSDMTMHIAYPTGDQLLQYADGSRLTRWADGTWTLQSEGLPCVYGWAAGWSVTTTAALSLTWAASDLALSFHQDQVCTGVTLGGMLCIGAPTASALLPC